MSPHALDLLDLVARWVHVIAGIMWVGNSLLFNWLDRSLHPADGTTRTARPLGTIWLLHSGGFYHVEKSLLHGEPLPRPLHWFKWQAYTTWLSGVALLLAVYYLGDRALLADPAVAPLGERAARVLGLAAIAGGWALYEVVQRAVAPRFPVAAAAAWLVGLAGIAVALTQLLAGRAAFLHVGAMLGTIMAGNVAMTIVPSQRALVASLAEGRDADPAVAARAKRVSVYNNYVTFPVVALMVSNHFPSVYGHRWSWLLLLLVVAVGVAVRHVLNLRFTWPAWRPALAATLAAGVAALWAVLALPAERGTAAADGGDAGVPARPTLADARHVIDRRCGACHSAQPSDLTFGATAGGVAFDTPEQIVAGAARIRARAVGSRTMPPGNRTRITEAERALLGRWVDQGAAAR